MKILFLSYYYPPDIGPAANRALAIQRALKKIFGAKLQIDILTTRPNRYATFNIDAPRAEKIDDIYIKRISVFKNIDERFKYPLSFLIYYFRSLNYVKGKKYDLILSTSGRLMTAFLGAKIARICNAPLYLDIRDLFVENLSQIFENRIYKIFLQLAYKIENYTFNSAKHINIVSRGFLPYIKLRWASKKISCYPNGVDKIFQIKKLLKKKIPNCPTILYAGNIGYGQALHKIIPKAAKLLEHSARFIIIGDGNCKKQLEDNLRQLNINNVELLPVMPRRNLKKYYLSADILFLNLDVMNSLNTVIPSKLFEYASTGKPILAGVSGFTQNFITEKIEGCETFDPCNSVYFEKAFNVLSNGPSSYNRNKFCEEYSLEKILDSYMREILEINTKDKLL